MIPSLLGRKIGMTRVYDAQNVLIPVTVVEAGPCPVVQVKTVESDGYNAVQLGFSRKKIKNTSKAALNHAKQAGLAEAPRVLGEVRLAEPPAVKPGDAVFFTTTGHLYTGLTAGTLYYVSVTGLTANSMIS